MLSLWMKKPVKKSEINVTDIIEIIVDSSHLILFFELLFIIKTYIKILKMILKPIDFLKINSLKSLREINLNLMLHNRT